MLSSLDKLVEATLNDNMEITATYESDPEKRALYNEEVNIHMNMSIGIDLMSHVYHQRGLLFCIERKAH